MCLLGYLCIGNKRAKMALNHSSEFKGVTVEIVGVIEIQFESA